MNMHAMVDGWNGSQVSELERVVGIGKHDIISMERCLVLSPCPPSQPTFLLPVLPSHVGLLYIAHT